MSWSSLARSPRVRAVLHALVSLALLAWLVRQMDWSAFWAVAPRARWGWLVVAWVLQAAGFGLSALRWQWVLRDLGIAEPAPRLLYWILLSAFWKQFLPTTVGGDGYRFWRAQTRHPDRRAAIFTSIFLDRLYGYLALLAVHGVLLLGVGDLLREGPRLLVWVEAAIGAGTLLGLALGWVWMRHGGRTNWGPAWLRPWLARAQHLWNLALTRSRSMVVGALAYSALFVLVNGLMLWAYLQVVGAAISWWPAVYASTLAAVLGALPITLNGLGLTEAALVLALTPTGLTQEQVLWAALLLRGTSLGLGLLGGILYSLEAGHRAWAQK